jgi:exodeoxyribonuclease VIII
MQQDTAEHDNAEQTDATRRGTATHAALLGNKRVMRVPAGAPTKPNARQRSAKRPSAETVAAIEWWAAFEAENATAIVLTPAKYDETMRMVESVRACPLAVDLIQAGTVVEQTILFSVSGRACRTTPDILAPSEFEAEIKTTRSAHPDDFMWQSKRYGWGTQHAWHMTGAEAAGRPVREAYTIAIEAQRPHPVTVFRMDTDILEHGRRCNRLWLEQIRTCEASNYWPAYAQTIVDLHLPGDDVDVGLVWSDEADTIGGDSA